MIAIRHSLPYGLGQDLRTAVDQVLDATKAPLGAGRLCTSRHVGVPESGSRSAPPRPNVRHSTRLGDKGLLLPSDVHTLFGRGYLTVTPDYKLRVSRRLRDDFDNGEHYYQYEKSDVWVPRPAEDRPSPEFLEWHGDTVFRG